MLIYRFTFEANRRTDSLINSKQIEGYYALYYCTYLILFPMESFTRNILFV